LTGYLILFGGDEGSAYADVLGLTMQWMNSTMRQKHLFVCINVF